MWIFFLIACGVKQRERPYSGEAAASEAGISKDSLIAIEDQFLYYTQNYGCTIRPPLSRWSTSADVFHKVELQFNSKKKLRAAKAIYDASQSKNQLRPELQEQIEKCFVDAATAAKGMLFPDAMPQSTVVLMLPLEPTK